MSDDHYSAKGITAYIVIGPWGGVGVRVNRSEIRLTLGWVGFAVVFSDVERTMTEMWRMSTIRILGEMRDAGSTQCKQSFESGGELVTVVTTRKEMIDE